MIHKLANSKLINRAFNSGGRVPGRIFGNYDQNSSEVPSSTSSSDYSSTQMNDSSSVRRTNEQTSSIVAFTEEALQNYELNAFKNASSAPFPPEMCSVLQEPIDDQLIEIKPDGNCYLPEVRYRKILNNAFGIGGWSLLPRGPHSLQGNVLSREYALFAIGKYVSQARGHTTISGSFQNPAMCTESVRSNSLMRCCKDLGIASVLWDNSFISQWKSKFAIRKSVTDYQGRNKYVWEKKKPDQY
jgi:hypothetical protein